MSIGRPIVNKTVYNTMLKAARKALKLARDPKEQKRAQARIDRIISMGFTKNVRSLGSKAVQSVKDKVTKNNKELTKQLESLKKSNSKKPTTTKLKVKGKPKKQSYLEK